MKDRLNYFINNINKKYSNLIKKDGEYFLNLEHPDANYFIQNMTNLELCLDDVTEVKIDLQNIYFKLKQSVEYVDIKITLD